MESVSYRPIRANNVTLETLPTFSVHRIDADRVVGVVDRMLWVDENFLVDLMLPEGRLLGGRFVQVDRETLAVAFEPGNADELPLLTVGQTYRRFDAFWGELAALVLDPHRHWTLRTFQAADAIATRGGSGTFVSKITEDEIPENGTVVPGGWDHEHCELCWATISALAEPAGMFSEPDHWVCVRCHEKFVVRKSLGFIPVEGQN